MLNFTTNTAIVNESWNGRGLILHNGVNHNLIRASDGTLWAAVRESHLRRLINIYRSTDNGFTWERMYSGDFAETTRRTGISGLNQNGPVMHLTLSEEHNRLILFHPYLNLTNNQFHIEPFIFDITPTGLVRRTQPADGATTQIVTDQDQLYFSMSYTNNIIFLAFVNFGSIRVRAFRHTALGGHDGQSQLVGTKYFNPMATYANKDDYLDILAVRDENPNYTIHHMRYDRVVGTISAPVVVSTFPETDIADLNLVRDGWGNLIAAWSQEDENGEYIHTKYSISKDNGATWSPVEDVPKEDGQTDYIDLATERLAARTVALGGSVGALIGYVRNQNERPTPFIRLLLSSDGEEYELSSEGLAVGRNDVITGFNFFRPAGNNLMDLENLGNVRVAYMVGEATSTIMMDTHPVRFGQQLLQESPSFAPRYKTFEQDESVYEGQVLVSFYVAGATDANVNYYALGVSGNVTRKYLAAFRKAATTTTLHRYEPKESSFLSDRSAYWDPDTYAVRVIIEPLSYGFPMPTGNDDFQKYIERDTRKVHLPPNFHLARTFLLNRGNNLKRTVWTMQYNGNEYELSQVTPRFIENQIAYYSANAYVVGPSNDPFSRVILPSET